MSATLIGASLYLTCGVSVCLLGLLVLRESPGGRLHRVTATMLFFGGFGPFLGGLGSILESLGAESSLLRGGLSTNFAYVWALFFPSLVLFALVFPRERWILRRFPRLIPFLYVPHLFHLALRLFLLRSGTEEAGFRPGSPVPGESVYLRLLVLSGRLAGLFWDLLARFHIRFFSLVNLVCIVGAILLLAQSLRGLRTPKLRRQLSVILFGLGTCMGLYALAVPVPTILSTPLPGGTRMLMVSVALLLGTGSIAFAIVWRGFLDVGTVVRRAILFSTTSGGLVVIYFLTARQMDRALMAEVGLPVPLFQTFFVILVVVFFHPLLGWMEEAVDRLLPGERLSHRNVLRKLGKELTALLDLRSLSATIARNLRDALAVERASLVLRDRGNLRFRAAEGEGRGLPPIPAGQPLIRGIAESQDPITASDLVEGIEVDADREEARGLLNAYGSRLLVPIRLPEGGGCIGFLSLGPKVTGGRFHPEEVTLLAILATQVGIAVRNARLHEEAVERKVVDEELALARTIQESILPRTSPVLDGLDVAGINVPSRQVGGDYYDLIPMGGGRLGIAIGDVSGKGVPAALLMSMLHAALHAQMNGSIPVPLLLARMNRILYRSTSPEKFASFFFGVYHPEDRQFRFTNGGHNFPVLLRRDGSILPLRAGGLALGIEEEETYEEGCVSLDVGDLVVFYTDGVTEEFGRDEEPFGEQRLIRAVAGRRLESAERIVRAVREEVAGFTGGDRFSDDFTLIVLRVDG